MKVFITWSGERSHRLARKLYGWLPTVLPQVKPWISSESIRSGAQWATELSQGLAGARYGIVCVTSENRREPWLLFEAGALSNAVEQSHVAPLLVDVQVSDLPEPLRLFQAVPASEEKIRKLARDINEVSEAERRSYEEVNRSFDNCWPGLREELDAIKREAPPTGTGTVDSEPDELDSIPGTSQAQVSFGASELPFAPSTQQEDLLTLLAESDTKMSVGSIAERMNVKIQRAQYLLDCLYPEGFVNYLPLRGRGKFWYLDKKGRAFLADKGLL